MNLSELIRTKIVQPVTNADKTWCTIARVTNVDERNNMCTVVYGNNITKERVSVRLYGAGTDWFPEIDDMVIIEISRDTCVVVARHVDNYNMDVRSKMKLEQDINSDSAGAPPGGYCY